MDFAALLSHFTAFSGVNTDLTANILVSAYRQHFLIADTDTADTEKYADMPIFPISILVSAHP